MDETIQRLWVGTLLGVGAIIAETHPQDIQTLVLTGYSSDGSNIIQAMVVAATKPACDVSARLKHLPEDPNIS